MYDVNPIGPLMHLKELDRQARQTSRLDWPPARSVLSQCAGRGMLLFLRRISPFWGQSANKVHDPDVQGTVSARS